MKIAQIICTFPPYKGGMGNVAFEFSKRLASMVHNVTVFTPDYGNIKIDDNFNFNIKRIKPSYKVGNAATLNKIGNELKDYDVIHLHYPFFGTAYFVYRFIKKNPDKKFIITYHMDAMSRGLKGIFFKVYAKLLMPKILKIADKITVSSIDYIKHSQASHIYNSHPDKFLELPFGVDLDHFKPTEKDKELMNKFSIQNDGKVLLFVGGLDIAHNFKGVELLINAINEIDQDSNSEIKSYNIKLIIVGDGDKKEYYENLVKNNNLENIIKFAGSASYHDLPKYYNLCDLLILPSTSSAEAFGLVLIEAMACDKPVLASNLPGVRTVPTNNEQIFEVGNIYDLTSKIKHLISKAKKNIDIKNTTRNKVEQKYNWDIEISRLENLYKK